MQPEIVLHSVRLLLASSMFCRADQGETQPVLLKDDRLVREKEVSEMLGVAIATLHAWRRVGKPPAFIRLGRAVRYRLSDLRELIRNGGYANRPGGGEDAS
jgi:predicted DNA-binding transcriptional regulator AlpA